MPSNMTKPSPSIRPPCPTILPLHKTFSSSEAKCTWHLGRGNKLRMMQTKYVIIVACRSILLTRHQVIGLDPSSLWGYEMKHAALHKAGDYDSATSAFEEMLSKMEQSTDPDIHRESVLVITVKTMICLHHPIERRKQYQTPSRIRAKIHKIVRKTIRDSPLKLIDTSTGKIYGRDERIVMFESSVICKELISSTTRISRSRIKRIVQEYFQYVVLSHKWEENEPRFQDMVHIAVYDLGDSPTHDKLQTYCKIAQKAGFQWAWSDTVCINKSDNFVLQESLVAMFRWYQGSALMVVFLVVSALRHHPVLSRGVSGTLAAGHSRSTSPPRTSGSTRRTGLFTKTCHYQTTKSRRKWSPRWNKPRGCLRDNSCHFVRAYPTSGKNCALLRPEAPRG